MRISFTISKYLMLSFILLAGVSNVSALNPVAAEKYFKNTDFSGVDHIMLYYQSKGNERVQFTITKRGGPRLVKAGKHALWISKPKTGWRMIIAYEKITYVHHKRGGDMHIVMQ